MKNLKKLRHAVFKESPTLDQDLINLASDEKSHRFLTNPSSLLVYMYLTEYVIQATKYWFKNKEIKLLDWGCGKGHITYLLNKRYPANDIEVHSCDVMPEADAKNDSSFLQRTPIIERANIEVIPLEHTYKLPFANDTYEVILSFGVLEHVPYDQKSLNEIYRVLKPGGLFFCFFLPYYLSWTQQLAHLRGNYYHDRLYKKKQAKKMLSDANLIALDMWHRQLLPKNNLHLKNYRLFERIDQYMCKFTFLKYLATNIEFVAVKEA